MAVDAAKLADLEQDIDFIGAVANGAVDENGDGTVLNRDGDTVKTMLRVLADLTATPYATWAELDAIGPTEGTYKQVLSSDTGTHDDPVTSEVGVPNGGVYRGVTGVPSGWERVGDNQADLAAAAAAQCTAVLAQITGYLGDIYEALLTSRSLSAKMPDTLDDGVRIPDLRGVNRSNLDADLYQAVLYAHWLGQRFHETSDGKSYIDGLSVDPAVLDAELYEQMLFVRSLMRQFINVVGSRLAVPYRDDKAMSLTDDYGLSVELAPDVLTERNAKALVRGLSGGATGVFRQVTDTGTGNEKIVLDTGATGSDLTDTSDYDFLAASGVDYTAPQPQGNSLAFFSTQAGKLNDYSGGSEAATARPYKTKQVAGATVLRASPKRAIIQYGFGQSLMENGVGGTSMSAYFPQLTGRCLMPNCGQRINSGGILAVRDMDDILPFRPVVSGGADGAESILMFSSARLAADHDVDVFIINTAIGGQKFSVLGPGTVPWTNGLNTLRLAVYELWALGYTEIDVVLDWQHGEADKAEKEGTYKRWMTLAHDAFRAFVRMLFGDPEKVVNLIVAPSPSNAESYVNTDMWLYTTENADAHWAGPILGDYMDPVTRIHPTIQGDYVIGDMRAKVYEELFFGSGTWRPMEPILGTQGRTSSSVYFDVWVPSGNLVDTADADYTALADGGLTVLTSALAEVAVTGYSIGATSANAAQLIFNTATDPGAGCILLPAWKDYGATNDPADFPHTPFRDQATYQARDGRTLYNRLGPAKLVVA